DGIMQLVLLGEWTSMNILEFDEKGMKLATDFSIEAPNLGWWNCIELADVDNDGDLDLIAGNVGLNNKFSPSETHPLHVFASDFDGNGTNDIVLAKTKNDELLPVRGRECSSQQMPFIAQKFSSYEAFAKAKLSDVFSPQALEEALHLQMNQAKSGVFLNESGEFTFLPFPNEAQLSPIKAMLCRDVNADGFVDLIFIGNQFNTEIETVRYDAGIGGVLMGDGSGKFVFVDEAKSGLMVPGDAKDLVEIPWGDRKLLIVTSNNSFLKLFER
ncbi:MAG: VCBS repeat-containing protein, partial [Bacteroidetes bacterium]|nr:VCBS repeat-containing protein [Bacteroidota bacterium]